MEKAEMTYAEYKKLHEQINAITTKFIGEFNNGDTRREIKRIINNQVPIPDGFIIVCDETNNSLEDIDNNMINVDIIPKVQTIELHFTVEKPTEETYE